MGDAVVGVTAAAISVVFASSAPARAAAGRLDVAAPRPAALGGIVVVLPRRGGWVLGFN